MAEAEAAAREELVAATEELSEAEREALPEEEAQEPRRLNESIDQKLCMLNG